MVGKSRSAFQVRTGGWLKPGRPGWARTGVPVYGERPGTDGPNVPDGWPGRTHFGRTAGNYTPLLQSRSGAAPKSGGYATPGNGLWGRFQLSKQLDPLGGQDGVVDFGYATPDAIDIA